MLPAPAFRVTRLHRGLRGPIFTRDLGVTFLLRLIHLADLKNRPPVYLFYRESYIPKSIKARVPKSIILEIKWGMTCRDWEIVAVRLRGRSCVGQA